jgi:hypothetical protein
MTTTPGHVPTAAGAATYVGMSPCGVRITSTAIAATTEHIRARSDAARRPAERSIETPGVTGLSALADRGGRAMVDGMERDHAGSWRDRVVRSSVHVDRGFLPTA